MSDDRTPKKGDVVHYYAIGSHACGPVDFTVTSAHSPTCVTGKFVLEGDTTAREARYVTRDNDRRTRPAKENLGRATQWWEWPPNA